MKANYKVRCSEWVNPSEFRQQREALAEAKRCAKSWPRCQVSCTDRFNRIIYDYDGDNEEIYSGTWSTNSAYCSKAWESISLKGLVRDLRTKIENESDGKNSGRYEVKDADGYIVAAGMYRNGRHYKMDVSFLAL